MGHPSSEKIAGSYLVCRNCHEGKFSWPGGFQEDSFQAWKTTHSEHGELEAVPGTKFLSHYLAIGYIDIDDETLLPIQPEASSADLPPGAHAGALGTAEVRALQRKMQQQHAVPLLPRDAPKTNDPFDTFCNEFKNWATSLHALGPQNDYLDRGMIRIETSKILTEEEGPVQVEWGMAGDPKAYNIWVDRPRLADFTADDIEFFAVESVIRISAYQRFGYDLQASCDWLVEAAATALKRIEEIRGG